MADTISNRPLLEPVRILAYDPGGTTGFAQVLVDIAAGTVVIEAIGEFKEWDLLDQQISLGKVVVYESFSYVSTSVNPISLEVIGVIKFLCRTYSITPKTHSPSQRKMLLKRWPDMFKGYSRHHMDALAHALTYVYFTIGLQKFHLIRSAPVVFQKQ